MIIITIRTDKPEAELGVYEDDHQVTYVSWEAHRQLAETIQLKLDDLLREAGQTVAQVQGLVIYKGPGSFTGLRIGISVGNALAYGLDVPVVGQTGENWQAQGIARLLKHETDGQVMPEYGAPVHITQPKR